MYNTLGYGFLEKVYENAMLIELKAMGLDCSNQKPVKVYYEGEVVGSYSADIFVCEKVIIELKASVSLCEKDEAQLINYLKGTEMEVGMLLNFGITPQYKRKVFSNKFKNLKNHD